MISISSQIQIPLKEIVFTFSKSSGPGGQKVNKTNTRVTLKWNLRTSRGLSAETKTWLGQKLKLSEDGTVTVISDRYRHQARNIADCIEKLRLKVMKASIRPKERTKTKPTKQSVERRLKEKQQRSSIKKVRQKLRDID